MRIRQRNAPEIKSWCVTFHSRTLQDRAIALSKPYSFHLIALVHFHLIKLRIAYDRTVGWVEERNPTQIIKPNTNLINFILDIMQYRRAKTPGATYFFTLVTHHRCSILDETENIDLLKGCFSLCNETTSL